MSPSGRASLSETPPKTRTGRPEGSQWRGASGRALELEEASQTQVHHFDEQEDDEQDEEEEEEDKLRQARQFYGGQSAVVGAQLREGASELGGLAYDSMSTILEVDSEEAPGWTSGGQEAWASGRQSSAADVSSLPMSHACSPEAASRPEAQEIGGRPRVEETSSRPEEAHTSGEPPSDKFSATFSALAAQLERLQRNRRPASQEGPHGGAAKGEPSGEHAGEPKGRERDGERSSRAASAEALMMIGASPPGSPASSRKETPVGAPADSLRAADSLRPEGSLRRAEVSHKSTETQIDLQLMERMVRRFLVETRETGTQSIEFDCGPEAEARTLSRRRASSSRSVAVGTEKFSRERFSLLPETKTRSTQTRANWQQDRRLGLVDLGASETRRFKLSLAGQSLFRNTASQRSDAESQSLGADGLSLGAASREPEAEPEVGGQTAGEALVRPPEAPREASQSPPEVDGPRSTSGAKSPPSANRKQQAESPRGAEDSLSEASGPAQSAQSSDSLAAELEAPSGRAGSAEVAASSKLQAQEDREKGRKTGRSGSGGGRAPEVGAGDVHQVGVGGAAEVRPRELSGCSLASGQQQPEVGVERKPEVGGKQKAEVGVEHKPEVAAGRVLSEEPPPRQRVASLRTELRVVIELKNCNRKQLSELTSSAQLLDGKLSKQTEVSCVKQVAVSPRQVLSRLSEAGERHSLLFLRAGAPPSGSASELGGARTNRAKAGLAEEDRLQWRELSRSVVRNELEADTRAHKAEVAPTGRGAPEAAECIVLSSRARVGQSAGEQSALELSSRAAKLLPGGAERLLAHSEASFDESQAAESRASASAASQPAGNKTRPEVATEQPPLPAEKEPKPEARGELRVSSPAATPPARVLTARSPATPPSPKALRAEAAVSPRATPTRLREGAARAGPKESARAAPKGRVRERLEIERSSEDRRQVTRDGRLVFDDRLRERSYESLESPARQVRAGEGAPAASPAPDWRGAPQLPRQREQQQRAQLLRPISLAARSERRPQQQPQSSAKPASPPLLFADHTSNLSEPETMDSGIVQSGAGSSHNLGPPTCGPGGPAAEQRQQQAALALRPGPLGSPAGPGRAASPTGAPSGPARDQEGRRAARHSSGAAPQQQGETIPRQTLARRQKQAQQQHGRQSRRTPQAAPPSLSFMDDEDPLTSDHQTDDDQLIAQLGPSAHRARPSGRGAPRGPGE